MKQQVAKQESYSSEAFEIVTGLEELNWVEFPLALLTSKAPAHLKTLRFQDTIEDSASGERIERRVLVSAADALTLPTWQDQDVLLAMMKHTRDSTGFSSPVVPFTLYKILKILNWPDNGTYRQRIKTALQKWNATWIRFENSFRRDSRWTTEKGFHVISYYELADAKHPDPNREQIFEWHRVVFDSIKAKHTKPLDWSFYIGLQLPSTKRLYRFLDKRFWITPKYSPLLVPFCQEKMGLGRDYKPNRYCKLLEPAIAELVSKKFLASISRERLFERVTSGVYRVHFHRHRRPKCESLNPLAAELTARGIDDAEADKLTKQFDDEHVRNQIEYFDSELKKKKVLGPGRLRAGITQRYKLPAGFETKAQTRAKAIQIAERQKQNHAAQLAREDAEEALLRTRESTTKAYLASLTTPEHDALVRRAVEAGSKLLRKLYTDAVRSGSHVATYYRDQMVQEYIQRRGGS